MSRIKSATTRACAHKLGKRVGTRSAIHRHRHERRRKRAFVSVARGEGENPRAPWVRPIGEADAGFPLMGTSRFSGLGPPAEPPEEPVRPRAVVGNHEREGRMARRRFTVDRYTCDDQVSTRAGQVQMEGWPCDGSPSSQPGHRPLPPCHKGRRRAQHQRRKIRRESDVLACALWHSRALRSPMLVRKFLNRNIRVKPIPAM